MAVAGGKQDPQDRRSALRLAGQRGLLGEEDVVTLPMDVGYRGPAACTAAGVTYRQLDYWARTGLVEPSVRNGAQNAPLYSLPDILLLKVAKRLLDTGISLQQIRTAVDHLRGRAAQDLARITLMSDGVSVYECTSPEEVVDLMQRGQGMFGLALAHVWRELEEALGVVPPEERADLPQAAPQAVDELARRRRERRTG
ncbi:transcriptional regulator [Nocardiopsis kunsanensis]|uniref:Transcriptional regulator n=2 Tax=Nocardiopsis kunsanensis TaxID=141693 RepID=A0A918X9V0_9ACTN|nr:transcriptional regulator [Nocardiopsis kunsanensis]